jgi:hypothetical protein
MVSRRKRFSHARVRSTTRAVPAQPFAGLNASTSDAALDAALSEVSAAKTVVVSLIGMEFLGPTAGSTVPAFDGRDGFQHGREDRAVLSMGARDFDRQRDALAVDHHVALGARFAPIGRIRAGEWAALFGRHAGAVQAGPAPINAVSLAEPVEQRVVNPAPKPLGVPLAEPAPAGHARTAAQFSGEQFPREAASEHKEDAAQDLPVGQPGSTAAGSRRFGRQQQFQYRPQRLIQKRFRHRLACHRFRALQRFC